RESVLLHGAIVGRRRDRSRRHAQGARARTVDRLQRADRRAALWCVSVLALEIDREQSERSRARHVPSVLLIAPLIPRSARDKLTKTETPTERCLKNSDSSS